MRILISAALLLGLLAFSPHSQADERCHPDGKRMLVSRINEIAQSPDPSTRIARIVEFVEVWRSACKIDKENREVIIGLGNLLSFPEILPYTPLMINQVWKKSDYISTQIRESYATERKAFADRASSIPVLTGYSNRSVDYLACLNDRVNRKVVRPKTCRILDRETKSVLE